MVAETFRVFIPQESSSGWLRLSLDKVIPPRDEEVIKRGNSKVLILLDKGFNVSIGVAVLDVLEILVGPDFLDFKLGGDVAKGGLPEVGRTAFFPPLRALRVKIVVIVVLSIRRVLGGQICVMKTRLLRRRVVTSRTSSRPPGCGRRWRWWRNMIGYVDVGSGVGDGMRGVSVRT